MPNNIEGYFIFGIVVPEQIVILSDSFTGCGWIKDGLHGNYLVHAIREQIILMVDKEFTIQWIPSHVGIHDHGNDEADDFAGRGAHMDTISPMNITYSDGLCEVRRLMAADWQLDYENNLTFSISRCSPL